MAERSNFKAMMLFTTFNVFIYAIPAHWMWSEIGWLRTLGARDLAGAGIVHQLGGFSGLVGAYFIGIYEKTYSKVRNSSTCGNKRAGENFSLKE